MAQGVTDGVQGITDLVALPAVAGEQRLRRPDRGWPRDIRSGAHDPRLGRGVLTLAPGNVDVQVRTTYGVEPTELSPLQAAEFLQR